MAGPGIVSTLADAFPEAALEPGFWPAASERFAGAFGEARALLAAAARGGAFGRFDAVRLDPAVLDRFGVR